MSRTRLVVLTTLCAGVTIVPAICKLARAQTAAFNAPAMTRTVTGAERPAKTVGQSRSGQPNTADNPDSILYRTGLDLLKKHQYKEARRDFQKLVDTYPDSSFVASSKLATGDAFYDEGGTANLLMARDKYIDFALLFRDHPKAEAAIRKATSINRMLSTRGDNREHNSKAESAAAETSGQYPADNYAPALKQYLKEIQQTLDRVNSAAPDHQFERRGDGHLSEYYRKWLNEEVVYIIYEEEREVFLSLKTDGERERFIERFWSGRNPNSASQSNYFKEEHYRRLAYVNERFASSVPGWKTSRGSIYIMYGPPTEMESGPAGGIFNFNDQLDHSMFAYELWRYRQIDSIGEYVAFLFVDARGTGNYVLPRECSGRWPPRKNHD